MANPDYLKALRALELAAKNADLRAHLANFKVKHMGEELSAVEVQDLEYSLVMLACAHSDLKRFH